MLEKTRINVSIEGLAPIMFDRFIDHSKEARPPEQKLYLDRDNMLVLPAANIIAFLFGDKVPGCAKRFEGKKCKDYIAVGQGHVYVDPLLIPFIQNDEPVIFTGLDSDMWYVNTEVPVVKSSGGSTTKQPNSGRPTFRLPWGLNFQISLITNHLITEGKLHNWFSAGGLQIGLGNYRPRHGRFYIQKWDIIED